MQENHGLSPVTNVNIPILKTTSFPIINGCSNTLAVRRNAKEKIRKSHSWHMSFEEQKTQEVTKGTTIQDNNDNSAGTDHDVGRSWCWVVLVGGFMHFFLASGMTHSAGLLYVPLLHGLGGSRADTAWVFSTNTAMHQLSTPLCGYVIAKFGPRAAVMIGGCVAAAGYLLSAFAPTLQVMYVTHGFVNAVGTSLSLSGWVAGISQYFLKDRCLALGIAKSGSGWGLITFGYVVANAIPEFGWRTAMVVFAGFSFNFCVFGALIYRNNPDKYLITGKRTEHIESGGSIIELKEVRLKKSENDSKTEFRNYHIQQSYILISFKKKTPETYLSSAYVTFINKEQIILVALQSSCILSLMSTNIFLILLIDWIDWNGVNNIRSYALVAAGIGDMIGRIIAGVVSFRFRSDNILFFFMGTHIFLALSMGLAALSHNAIMVLCSVVGVGISYGLLDIFTVLIPMYKVSDKILKTLLMAGGVSAFIGPPLAGFLVDHTNNYSLVFILSALLPTSAVVVCVLCYFLTIKCTIFCVNWNHTSSNL